MKEGKKNAEQLKKEERERQKSLQQAHDRQMRLRFEAKQRERLVRRSQTAMGKSRIVTVGVSGARTLTRFAS
jgi:hypothetical protein